MSTLVVQLPPRARAEAPDGATARDTEAALTGLVWWRLGDDEARPVAQGVGVPTPVRRGEAAVVLLDAADASWHRVTLPRVPRSRLPQALAGLLEDSLLQDAPGVHFAVEKGAAAGSAGWVAAVDRAWLERQLESLARIGLEVSRVAPLAWPLAEGTHGHFDTPPGAGTDVGRVTLCDPDGVSCLPLAGTDTASTLRALTVSRGPQAPAWTATAAAVALAERLTGGTVAVRTSEDSARRALESPWDLLQFELAPRQAASRRLARAWQSLWSAAWRPVRLGIVALALTQLAGLGIAAWQLQRQLEERRAQQLALLRETFPQVRAVLDAPLQMQREVALLRDAAGRGDAAGFERALQTAAAGWPAGQAPAGRIEFERGRLTLTVPGWSEAQRSAFAQALRGSGWSARATGERVMLVAEPTGAAGGGDGAR